MIYRYLSKFYGISHYFSETLTEVPVRRKICKWLYSKLEEKVKKNVRGSKPGLVMMKAHELQRY